MRFSRIRCSTCAFALLVLAVPAIAADAPFHERIDQLIAKGHKEYAKVASPIASDAEFLRRVSLDLTGRIPSAVDARVFLDDKSADKRKHQRQQTGVESGDDH
jgi:hypothetical protein